MGSTNINQKQPARWPPSRAVARSGKEGVGDFKAALLLHLKTGSFFADMGPGTGGELSASGRAALDSHCDFLKTDPEHVVEQEGGAFERREPLERKHQRQGDVLFPFLILLDNRLRKPRADVGLSGPLRGPQPLHPGDKIRIGDLS